jgi:peptide deformylase
MIKNIIQAPDPQLKLTATPMPVEPGPEHRLVIKDLLDTFDATSNCIGLAAPQLGYLWRAIVVDVLPERGQTYVMVNPTILKLSSDLQLVRDGCMSVDHGQRFAQTKRPKRLLVEWRDPLTWELKRQKFTGLMAACIHHEIDHLDGILFVDRIIVARMNRFTLQ